MNNELDTLKLFIKKEQFNTIINSYELLGWKVESQTENSRYEDIIDVTLTRPHKIENKDNLQLLQIYIEENLNSQAKLEKNKHSKTLMFNLCLGLTGLMFLLYGVLSLVNVIEFVSLALSIPFIVLGAMLLCVQAIFSAKIFKLETKMFNDKSKKLKSELEFLHKKANDFWGECNG